MPLGDPQGYMEQGMPPEEAMMMAGGPPPMGPPMGPPMPPMGPDPMMGGAPPMGDPMEMLFGAVQGKWNQQEASLAGEQDMLLQTLMLLAGATPPEPQDMFAEGAPMNAGMMPEDDVMGMGGAPDAGGY